jgi:hypothetical protein
MDDVGTFYSHKDYFTSIGYILWPYGTFCGHFGVVFPFWYTAPRKIWQPCSCERGDHPSLTIAHTCSK